MTERAYAGEHGKTLRDSGWNGVAQATRAGTVLAVAPFLIGQLGLDRYGVWSLVLTFVILAGSLDGGVGASLTRFLAIRAAAEERAAATRLFATATVATLTLGGLVAVAVAVSADSLVSFTNTPASVASEAAFVVRGAGVLLVLNMLANLLGAVLHAHSRFRANATAVIAGQSVYVAALVHQVVAVDARLPGVWLAAVAGLSVHTGVAAAMARAHLEVRQFGLVDRAARRDFVAYALKMQVSALTMIANTYLDALIIAVLLPVSSVGLYNVGYQAATATRMLPLWSMLPVLALLSRAFGEGGLPRAASVYKRVEAAWQQSALPYCATAVAVSGFLVVGLLGTGSRAAAIVAIVLAAGYATNVATAPASALVRAVGRPGLEMRYGILTAALNLVLTVPMTIAFGLNGVVIATASTTAFGSIYFARTVRRDIPRAISTSIDVATLALPAFAVVAVGSALMSIDAPRPLLAGVPIIAAAVALLIVFRSRLTGLVADVRLLQH